MLGLFLRSRHKSILLMLLAIVQIAGFQVFWLFESYENQERLLRKELSILFRESAFGDLMRMKGINDTLLPFSRQQNGQGDEVDVLVMMRKDSMPPPPPEFSVNDAVRINTLIHSDTVHLSKMSAGPSRAQVLTSFKKALAQEGYHLTVWLEESPGFERPRELENGIIYTNPIPRDLFATTPSHRPIHFFRAGLSGYRDQLLMRLLPQFALSLLLVAVTVLAFVVLWRNLRTQQRMAKQKEQLVSNITHELKTPIATVSVAIEALQKFNASTDPQRTREYLDIAGQQVNRLSLLVDKVLRLSMFQGDRIALQLEPVDLLSLAKEVIAPLHLQFESDGGTLTLETIGSSFMLNGDRQHLLSLLFNLLDNGWKYGGTPPQVSLTLHEKPDAVCIIVRDNGPGIPEAYQQKIFEPFFRIPVVGQRHTIKGHGLGLSYVAEIVRLHKGIISITNNANGAVFTLQFPRYEH